MTRTMNAWGTVLMLAVLGAGCDRTSPPPPVPTPTPAPRLPVHIVLFVYPAPAVKGECAVVTVPQHADVNQKDDLVWDVVNDACEKAGDVTISFKTPVVDLEKGDRKQKKGKVKADAPYGTHKYSVELVASGFVEDPEIEIHK